MSHISTRGGGGGVGPMVLGSGWVTSVLGVGGLHLY